MKALTQTRIAVRRFRADSPAVMRELHREFGDVTVFKVGPYRMHQVAAPELVRDVLQDNTGVYRRGQVYRGFELIFGTGMLTADGEQWRSLRAAGRPFYRAGFLNDSMPLITGTVRDLVRGWADIARQGQPIDVVPHVMRLAMGVVSRVVYGIDVRHRSDELHPAVMAALTVMMPGSTAQLLPGWLPGPHRRGLRLARSRIDGAMAEVLAAHEQGRGAGAGMAGVLSGMTDPSTGEPLTRQQIVDELKTHFLAGHETTGCGLAWTLHEIATHPDVQDRLGAELDTVLNGREPSTDDLAALPYLRQVVAESLRLHPPIPYFPREPVRDVEIGGCPIPAGSTIFLSQYTVHHDPAHWPDPDRFDPDRWAPDRPGPARYTYFPFGGGQRRCVGAPLAELEIQVAVAMIAQRFRLTPVPGRPVVPQATISLRPRHGLVMTIADKGESR